MNTIVDMNSWRIQIFFFAGRWSVWIYADYNNIHGAYFNSFLVYRFYKLIEKYDTKILLGDLNAKVGNGGIYGKTTEGKSKHNVKNQKWRITDGICIGKRHEDNEQIFWL